MIKAYTEEGNFYGYVPEGNVARLAQLGLSVEAPHEGAKLQIYLEGGGYNFYTAEWDDPNRGAYYNTPTLSQSGRVVHGGWTDPHPDWIDIPEHVALALEAAANAFTQSLRQSGIDIPATLLAEKSASDITFRLCGRMP